MDFNKLKNTVFKLNNDDYDNVMSTLDDAGFKWVTCRDIFELTPYPLCRYGEVYIFIHEPECGGFNILTYGKGVYGDDRKKYKLINKDDVLRLINGV